MELDLQELFKRIDESESIADLFELDAIPPINFSNEFFFISYSHSDYKMIYKDIYSFQKEGVSVWFDRGMKPGSDWLENAEHFISQFACKGIIIYFSKNSLSSNAVLQEILLANTYHKPLMPIVIDKDKLIDGNIAKTIIHNLSLKGEEAAIVSKSFTDRTLWVDASFPIKSKVNYVVNLKDDTNLLEVVDLDENNSPILLKSHGTAKGKMIAQVNDPYCMRVNIPLDIKYIGDATFTNMANLKEVNLSHVVEVDSYAFADARQLKEVDLTNVKYLGDSAFERCSELESIKFPFVKTFVEVLNDYDSIEYNPGDDEPDIDFGEVTKDWYVDDDSAYGEGNRIMPNEEEYQIKEYYGKNAFAHCDSLKELTLEHTFKEVPEGMFHDCKSLETVVFDGPNIIGPRAFYNCSNLKSVVFKDDYETYEDFSDFEETRMAVYKDKKVMEIGDSAFENCSSLELPELPFELKRLGAAAFKNSGINPTYLYVNVPHGEQAFMGSNISKIDFGPMDISNEVCRGCKNLKEIDINIGEYSVGASAFRDCPSLTTVFVNAKEILKSAFSHSGMNRVIIDKNVEFAREFAFSNCENLEYLQIRSKNLSIAPHALYKDNIKYLYIAKECRLVLDPFSLEEAEIEYIYYDGEMEDVAQGKLQIEIDYVDDPNNTNAFLFEEDEKEYNENRTNTLAEQRGILLPYIVSRIVFYSTYPIYDGRHWRFSRETKLPEIWVEE